MAINPSMFESFNPYELEALGLTSQAPRPKAVLFGDSMSEYVGYKPDGSVDDKYGASVAEVIGRNLGIPVENLATGGETSSEALAGSAKKFGSFADYIQQNQPEYAILRYGAADAIKNKNVQTTLDSIKQMIEVSLANGTTPVLVGVSELYGSQNSKTGNIAGYIDPDAERRANEINDGIAQLARQYGVTFTDVRSAVSAGKGDLLDGVHANADFGKKMADAISESIVQQNAITGVNVPQLPANVDSLSAQEKGRLYNDLISQGYSDAQIRTAAKAESDQDWNALKQVAASVKNTTPAEIERKTALSAVSTPEIASKPLLSNYIQQATDFLNSPENLRMAEGAAQMQQVTLPDGRTINVYPDGTAQEFTDGRVKIYNSAGETILNQTQQEYAQPGYLSPVINALMAAAGGAVLGPAGAGLLSAPTAAAAAAGGTNLLRGGSIEDALKAAAIGGLGALGTEQVLGMFNNAAYSTSFAAADAAQLANQGLSASQIAQNLSTYIDPALAQSLANTAANSAFALADANQLVQQGLNANQVSQVLQASGVNAATAASLAQAATEGVTQLSPSDIVPDLKFQKTVGTSSQLPTLPDSVTVTGQGITGDLFNIPTTSVGGLLSAAALPILPTAGVPPQQVTITGQTQPTQAGSTAATMAGGAASALVPTTAPAATQQVQVAGKAGGTLDADSASAALSSLLGQAVNVQGSTQKVDITGKTLGQTITPEIAGALLSAAVGQQVLVTGATVPGVTTAPTTAGGLLSSLVPTQTVPVTSTTVATTPTAPTTVGGAVSALVPTQTVPVTAKTIPTTTTPTTVGGAASALIPTQTVPVEDRFIKTQTTAPVIPVTPAEQVVVAGNRVVPISEAVIPAGAAGAAAGVTAPSTTTTTTDQSLFKPSDVLKLIGLLGGAGAGSALAGAGGGVGMGGVPPSDVMIGTTTPQFSPDYYAAIQRYYNTYMPQTPRNVATPLQQWYENKFGA